ncbi:MAG: alpha/beta hydrolase [Planctomycetes bacterium]|nr:alpha/beta hydrolase [Planctomycetota bacterium]
MAKKPEAPGGAKRQETEREKLWGLLGDLPPRERPISAEKVAEEQHPAYTIERLMLDLNGIELVPAYFVRPKRLKGRAPAVLFNHSHGGNYLQGKEELVVPNNYLQRPAYAEALAREGYCSLCIDTWNFGERRGRTESELFKEMLWRGQVLWGMMMYDSVRAVDYLVSRREVDARRIGTLGLSMGSTMAWWLAALDTRIRVCVDICCLTDFQALVETRGLDGHGFYYFVPSLLKHFSTAQINSLIAPRAHLSLAGNYDKLTPPAGLDRIDAELKRVYMESGAPEAWRLVRHEIGHFETAAMRAEILRFLRKWLSWG